MPGYMIHGRFTPQGVKDIKSLPDRLKQDRVAIQGAGARVVGIWVTFGRYDVMAVIDAPDDQTAAVVALGLAGEGNLTTETVRALSEDEFAQVVQRLP